MEDAIFRNDEVVGSIPTSSTKSFKHLRDTSGSRCHTLVTIRGCHIKNVNAKSLGLPEELPQSLLPACIPCPRSKCRVASTRWAGWDVISKAWRERRKSSIEAGRQLPCETHAERWPRGSRRRSANRYTG
jgi:hypothetical protein